MIWFVSLFQSLATTICHLQAFKPETDMLINVPGGWEMVERRGRCGEYDRETGRRVHFQVRLFETSLVDLSNRGWMVNRSVRIRCWLGRKGCVACRRLSHTRPFQIWYVTSYSSHSPFHFPRRIIVLRTRIGAGKAKVNRGICQQ